jgi:hypothetical protein
MILLLPNDPNHASRIRRDQSDSDGSFALPNVVPGHYTLLAIDDGRDLAYQDPAVMEPYLTHGLSLDVPLKDSSHIQTSRSHPAPLTAIHAGPASPCSTPPPRR